MMSLKFLIANTILAMTTIVSGLMQGHATYRWGVSEELAKAGQALETWQFETDNWKLDQEQAFAPEVLKLINANSSLKHVYQNKVTKKVIAVALLVGPTGPLVVHTPVVCYPANSYELIKEPARLKLVSNNGTSHEVFAVTFRANNVHQNYLRVYYAWADKHGKYKAPDNPRIAFATERFLYRLQVAMPMRFENDASSDEAAIEFLRHVLAQPIWQRSSQAPHIQQLVNHGLQHHPLNNE